VLADWKWFVPLDDPTERFARRAGRSRGVAMDDVLTRFLNDLVGRLTGPLTPRLFLQPAVAIFFAIRDGMQDARDGRPPHLLRVLTGPPEARRRRRRETRKAVLKVFIMAVLLDFVYQWIVFRWVYPMESLVTAIILAFLPYLFLRGLVNRAVRPWIGPQSASSR